jgi:hypothetical protein
MHGQVIFPARSVNLAKISDVDQFLAARVGAAAYEASASATASADAYAGIFTTCFLNAFRHPYTEMVQSSLRDGLVVPNRRLKLYLAQEVPKLASQIDIKLVQQPDSKVLCDDVTYIGHASASDRPVSGRDLPTVLDVARLEIWGKNGAPGTGSTFLPAAIEAVATTSGFNNAREVVVRSRGLASDPSVRSGFTISGTRVESVVAGGGAEAKVIEATESNSASATISVDLRGQRAVSVAVRFVDGSGTVLAAIAQFIGNVVVDKGLVSNVSYAPSRTSPLWSTYNQEALRLESLHSAVAAAARLGVFRVEGPKATRQSESSRFADRIRVLKGIDPTLGLYAAYAYADAGLRDGVASVRSNMFNNLEVHLFDIELLSDHLSGRDSTAGDTVPCCPMLSQGWGLLRVKNVRLPDSIRALQDHLRVSLWTTLDNKGMQIVENELKVGKLR